MKPFGKWSRLFFYAGWVLFAIGVFLYWLLEWHSFTDTTDLLFEVLQWGFIAALLIGALLAFAGATLMCFTAPPKTAIHHGWITAAVGALFALATHSILNVHTWTAGFLLACFLSWLLGGELLLIGIVRLVFDRKAPPVLR